MKRGKLQVLGLCRVSAAVLLLALTLACAAVVNGGPASWEYEGWGDQLQYHREDDFAYKDGSSWTDGISSTPPPLPVFLKDTQGAPMTCAQEEIIWMLAFPRDRDMGNWRSNPDADEIARQWRANFLQFVWGYVHPAPNETRTRESFGERCGTPLP